MQRQIAAKDQRDVLKRGGSWGFIKLTRVANHMVGWK